MRQKTPVVMGPEVVGNRLHPLGAALQHLGQCCLQPGALQVIKADLAHRSSRRKIGSLRVAPHPGRSLPVTWNPATFGAKQTETEAVLWVVAFSKRPPERT